MIQSNGNTRDWQHPYPPDAALTHNPQFPRSSESSKSNLAKSNLATHRSHAKGPLHRLEITSYREKLGQIFVRHQKITPDQLKTVLAQQAYSKQRIGQLLVENGFISQRDLRKALREQTAYLGGILLQRGSITTDQLHTALLKQVQDPMPLGEVLVNLGMLSLNELEDALQEQYIRRKGFWFGNRINHSYPREACNHRPW